MLQYNWILEHYNGPRRKCFQAQHPSGNAYSRIPLIVLHVIYSRCLVGKLWKNLEFRMNPLLVFSFIFLEKFHFKVFLTCCFIFRGLHYIWRRGEGARPPRPPWLRHWKVLISVLMGWFTACETKTWRGLLKPGVKFMTTCSLDYYSNAYIFYRNMIKKL